MKPVIKSILISCFFILSFLNANAQDDKTVTLVVSGSGKTQEEAKQNALRSAIEQAFGAFISSKTEILDDTLVKDEIVAVSNGNIQKYDIISEVQTPDGKFATTLNAVVSVSKLTSFAESKGVVVEFKGSLFSANLKQQKINEEAELIAILNLCQTSNIILSKSLDYIVQADEPRKSSSSMPDNSELFELLLKVRANPNDNFNKFVSYFKSTFRGISMSEAERENYKKLNKKIYALNFDEIEGSNFYLRNFNSAIALQNFFLKSNQFIHNYIVQINFESKIDSLTVKTCCLGQGNDKISAQNFMPKDQNEDFDYWRVNYDSTEIPGFPKDGLGYPNFKFTTGILYDLYNHNLKQHSESSWSIYNDWNKALRNNILLDEAFYYSGTGQFYAEKGNGNSFFNFNFINKESFGVLVNFNTKEEVYLIGTIKFKKNVHLSKYVARYSEDEISKIRSISISQAKQF